jgi:hypothetical protein
MSEVRFDCEDPAMSWRNGLSYPRGLVGSAARVAYISGPMRGYEEFNFPAFFRAEARLNGAGFVTINPARIDTSCPQPHVDAALDSYVARDLEAVKSLRPNIDVVVVLEGWAASEGATAEVAVAEWRGVEIWDLATALSRTGATTLDEAFAYRAGSLDIAERADGSRTSQYVPLPQADGADVDHEDGPEWHVADPLPEGWGQRADDAVNVAFAKDEEVVHFETRITDPVTGGQKGTKPVRFDLIPDRFAGSVNARRSSSSAAAAIRDNLNVFWRGAAEVLGWSRASLIRAAEMCENALGGPVAARYHIARVYGVGAQKYDDNNWRKGYRWSLSYTAALRHLDAIERGEMMDAEMGVPHYANVWWHCATLWTFATEGLGTDDRPVSKEAA